MKFIRKNGRVIPIKDAGQGKGAHQVALAPRKATKKIDAGQAMHAKFFAAGVAQRAVMKSLPMTSALIGIGSFGANIKNSIAHGQEKHSGLHGTGRFLANAWAGNAGIMAAHFGIKGAVAGLRSQAVRNGAKTAGRLLLK